MSTVVLGRNTEMRKLLILLAFLFASCAHAQVMQQAIVNIPPPSTGGTFAVANYVADRCVWANDLTCSGTSLVLTVPSTGADHELVLFYSDGSAQTISSVSGGCSGSWTVQSSAHVTSGPVGSVNAATCSSSSSGTTSITVTASASSSSQGSIIYYEVSYTGTFSSFSAGAINDSTASTSLTGVTPSLSGGAVYAVFQIMELSTGEPSSVSTYTNFIYQNNQGDLLGGVAAAYLLNTTSTTAPIWSISSAQYGLGSSIALAGN